MNSTEATDSISGDCPTNLTILIGDSDPRAMFRRAWYQQFKELEPAHQQPWFDRTLVKLGGSLKHYQAFMALDSRHRGYAFKILAAKLWNKNKPIDILGLTAVKIEDPPGTGMVQTDVGSSICVVDDLRTKIGRS